MAGKWGSKNTRERHKLTPMQRFLSFCRFEPETGCVLWTGAQSMGRGHHVPYGTFWFEGRRWFAHRWSAKFVHGIEIDNMQVDHCCDTIPLPNTLCVQHVQALTPAQNRELQHRRKHVHLEVGLLRYEDVYGPAPDVEDLDLPPYYEPPAWLGIKGPTDDRTTDCPF